MVQLDCPKSHAMQMRETKRKTLVTLAIAVSLAGVFAGGSAIAMGQRSDDKLPMMANGAPVDCVSLRQIRSTKVVDDRTIDFRMAGGKTLRNSLPHSCPRLKFEDRFSYRTSLGQLCSIDTIRVLHDYGGRLQEGAGCGLGKFQPVVPATGG